jgi:IS5 family transposase
LTTTCQRLTIGRWRSSSISPSATTCRYGRAIGGCIHVDKGYRGHNHKEKFRVWITGQVRRVTRPLRREMKRRAAVEPVIGHVKVEHRMGRNYLKGRDGDRINAVLAAAGYNFSLLLRWLARPLRALVRMLFEAPPTPNCG